MLTAEEKQRYHRHILLPQWGEEGQERIKAGRVLIIGLGGLGSPVALYLAAAGVGKLGLVDSDRVDLSNLQRQIIHSTLDLSKPKVESAAEKVKKINPLLSVECIEDYFSAENAFNYWADYDLVLDCTDNYQTKYLINDLCVAQGTPFVHGSLDGYEGQIMTWLPGCYSYRDFFPTPPIPSEKTEDPLPVFSPLPGVIGTLQACEALKYLSNCGELLTNRLLLVDTLTMQFHTFTRAK